MTQQPLNMEDVKARIRRAVQESKASPRRRDVPLNFELVYDCTKLKSRNPATRLEYQQKHTLWCTLFPNGAVSLERPLNNVNFFRSLTECKNHFDQLGEYEIHWLGAEEEQ